MSDILSLPPKSPTTAYTDYAGFEYTDLQIGSQEVCGGCGREFQVRLDRDSYGERHGRISVQDRGHRDGSLGVFCGDFCAGRIFERYVQERKP